MKNFNSKEAADLLKIGEKELRKVARQYLTKEGKRWIFTEEDITLLTGYIAKSEKETELKLNPHQEGLTALEISLLNKLAKAQEWSRDERFSDVALEDVTDNLRRDRGVLSSLIKKELVTTDYIDSGYLIIYVTDKGWAAAGYEPLGD